MTIRVRVQFFSRLKEIAVAEPVERNIRSGSSAGDLLAELEAEFPRLAEWRGKLLLAVGTEFAALDQLLVENDLVSVMPPVQGG